MACESFVWHQHPGIDRFDFDYQLFSLKTLHLHRLAILHGFGLNRRCRIGPRKLDRKLYPINALRLDDPRLSDEEFFKRLRPLLAKAVEREATTKTANPPI